MQVKMHMVIKWQTWSRDCKKVGNPAKVSRVISCETRYRSRAQTEEAEHQEQEGGEEVSRTLKNYCGN